MRTGRLSYIITSLSFSLKNARKILSKDLKKKQPKTETWYTVNQVIFTLMIYAGKKNFSVWIPSYTRLCHLSLFLILRLILCSCWNCFTPSFHTRTDRDTSWHLLILQKPLDEIPHLAPTPFWIIFLRSKQVTCLPSRYFKEFSFSLHLPDGWHRLNAVSS